SAWVTPLTLNSAGTSACSWSIRFYPYAAVEAGDTGAIAGPRYGALGEGNSEKFYVRTADFALPLSATARIKAGVNGCSSAGCFQARLLVLVWARRDPNPVVWVTAPGTPLPGRRGRADARRAHA